ncbi:MAG: hypothetical protein AAGA31_04370 [Bacteroidota bacterium]
MTIVLGLLITGGFNYEAIIGLNGSGYEMGTSYHIRELIAIVLLLISIELVVKIKTS